jgi:protein-disulfide isomerase
VGLVSAAAAYLLFDFVRSTRQQHAIAAHAEEIFRAPHSFVAGNPDGDVSVVAFFDYNCPYCRASAPDLGKFVKDDGKVRLVLKELPVLGRDSDAVARVALAAREQGKYFELYRRLISERGLATKDRALRIASELGLDTAKLESDMRQPAVEQALAADKTLAARIGIRGVPFYLVGDRPIADGDGPGLYAALAAAAAGIRKNGCRAQC